MHRTYDVIVVGGGPAGLSAAMFLGRACRRVLVCDAGRPRNRASEAIHGFLTRDGIPPGEFRDIGLEELRKYDVTVINNAVTDTCRFRPNAKRPSARKALSPPPGGLGRPRFEAVLADGTRLHARKLLLATGVADQLPQLEGVSDFYGRGVFHCPYCDAWEYRARRLAAYGRGVKGLNLALSLRTWSEDVAVCLDGTRLTVDQRRRAAAQGLALYSAKIARLEGEKGRLSRIVFETGDALECEALFFNTGQVQRSDLPARMGCLRNPKGGVAVDKRGRTSVPGVYLAGDASRDVQFVVTAASEGAKAALAINRDLQDEEVAERERQARAARVGRPDPDAAGDHRSSRRSALPPERPAHRGPPAVGRTARQTPVTNELSTYNGARTRRRVARVAGQTR